MNHTATASQTACRICGNVEGNADHSVREMMYGTRDSFLYTECARCGCLQLEEAPADLSPYYPTDFYSFGATGGWRQSSALRGSLKRHHTRYELGDRDPLGWFAARIRPHWTVPGWLTTTKPPRDSAILDVGCGDGRHLRYLADLGFTNLCGIDPHIASDTRYPDGVRVLKKSLADVDATYDIVRFNHSFEHVPDPAETLAHLARILRGDGVAVIHQPVAGCAAWEEYGTDWVQIDAPRHLYLLNERSMRILADGAGLVLTGVTSDSKSFQFTASEGYRRDIALVDQDDQDYLTPTEKERFEARTAEVDAAGTGDEATFYLSHPSYLTHPSQPKADA